MSANEYTAGDLVEAIKGETVIRGRLKTDELGLHLWVGDSGRTPENLESYGFTLSIIEKAAAVVVLPTEPGVYLDKDEDIWSVNGFGSLRFLMGYSVFGNPENYAPFTRLEPVSETAKKVLDRVNGYGIDNELDFEPFLKKIAADFGVEL